MKKRFSNPKVLSKQTIERKNFESKNSIYIYTEHCVFAAIDNKNRIIHKIYALNKYEDSLYSAIGKSKKSIEVEIVDNDFLNSLMSDDGNHQGVIALVDRLIYDNLSQVLHNDISASESNMFVILDQVKDSRNIGAIIRTCVAFNVKGIVFNNTNFPQENSHMVRSSVGTIEKIKLIEVSNLVNAMDLFKKYNFWIVGLDSHASDDIKNIQDFKNTVLVLGSESDGMRQLIKKNCDILCKINMKNNVESLNISNAAAIALYQLT